MKSFKKFTSDANRRKDKVEEKPFEMPKKGENLELLADDLEPIQKEIDKSQKAIKLKDDDWELVSIIDITAKEPQIKEAIIVNADLGNTEVSRGDELYITAMLRKKEAKYYFFSSKSPSTMVSSAPSDFFSDSEEVSALFSCEALYTASPRVIDASVRAVSEA